MFMHPSGECHEVMCHALLFWFPSSYLPSVGMASLLSHSVYKVALFLYLSCVCQNQAWSEILCPQGLVVSFDMSSPTWRTLRKSPRIQRRKLIFFFRNWARGIAFKKRHCNPEARAERKGAPRRWERALSLILDVYDALETHLLVLHWAGFVHGES